MTSSTAFLFFSAFALCVAVGSFVLYHVRLVRYIRELDTESDGSSHLLWPSLEIDDGDVEEIETLPVARPDWVPPVAQPDWVRTVGPLERVRAMGAISVKDTWSTVAHTRT